MTEIKDSDETQEISAEAPPEPPPAPEAPVGGVAEPNMDEAPIYVYAIAMMPDGEVKLITQLPFLSHRQALMSDVTMTASFVVSAIKDGKL